MHYITLTSSVYRATLKRSHKLQHHAKSKLELWQGRASTACATHHEIKYGIIDEALYLMISLCLGTH